MCGVDNAVLPVHAQVHIGILAQYLLHFPIFLVAYQAYRLLRFLFTDKCSPTCAFSQASFERLPTQIMLQRMFFNAVHYFFSIVKFWSNLWLVGVIEMKTLKTKV